MADNITKTNPAWIIGITTVITIGMTVFNGFSTAQISKAKTSIEQQAQELEAARARVERYGFVQKLFPDLLSPDSSKRTLTINLVTLTLTPAEAQQLFRGMQGSSDAHVQALGDAGAATLAADNPQPLVTQLNGGTASERIAAFQKLRTSFNSSTMAISQVLALFDEDQIDQLSASGRINTLLFLAGTEASAWTAEQAAQGEDIVARIEKRQARGSWHMGAKTRDALNAFKAQLSRAQQA